MQITVPPVGGDKQEGDAHTFSVTVTGGYAPLLYTWKQDSVTVSSEQEYVISSLTTDHSGSYTVEVIDDNTDFIESTPVDLNVTVSNVPAVGLIGLALLAAGLGCAGCFSTKKKK